MAELYDAKPPKNSRDPITIKQIKAPANGRILIADQHRDAPRGFTLKVAKTGAKAFALRYRVGTRDRLVIIGEYGTWTLKAARLQAHAIRRQIDAGNDPLAQREEAAKDPTVADVVEEYCRRHADKQVSGRKVRRVLEMHFTPKMKHKKLHEVRRRDVIDLVEGVAAIYPRQAAMLLTYVKLVFAWAEDREIIEANPVATLKPHKIDPRMKSKSRSRVLTSDEISAFWNSADKSPLHRLTGLALKFVLVTGQRPGEVAGMRWDEIESDTWTIPASRRGKTANTHSVPLTPTALNLLTEARDEVKRLAERRGYASYVFVFEARPGAPLTVSAIDRAVKRHAAALGNLDMPEGGHWRPHDLRRTCRTRLSAAQVPESVAEVVIGHTRKGIIGVYDQHAYVEEKRSALQAWEKQLLVIIQD